MKTAAGVGVLLVSLAVGGCATSIRQAEPTVASRVGPPPAARTCPCAVGHAANPSAAIAATPLSRRVPRHDPDLPQAGAAPARDFVSEANIGGMVRGIRSRRDARIELGVHDFARDLEDRIYGRTRLCFSAAYTMLYQHATDGSGPRDAPGADFDLVAVWVPVGRKGGDQGGLEARL